MRVSVFEFDANPAIDLPHHYASKQFAAWLLYQKSAKLIGKRQLQMLGAENFRLLKERYRRHTAVIVHAVPTVPGAGEGALILTYPLPDQCSNPKPFGAGQHRT